MFPTPKHQSKLVRDLAVVFDWDGVIFDTAAMTKIRDRVIKKLGYSIHHIKSTSREAVESKEGYNYHLHAKLLIRDGSSDPAAIVKMVYDEIEKHPGTFIFPDARRIVSSLKRAGQNLDILTSGHKEFQEYKLLRSGLHSMFRNIHIVQSGPKVPQYKLGMLKKLVRAHGHIIFLDDRADTIETIWHSAALRGKVLPILVWRKKEGPPANLPMVQSLSWKGIQKIAIHNGFKP